MDDINSTEMEETLPYMPVKINGMNVEDIAPPEIFEEPTNRPEIGKGSIPFWPANRESRIGDIVQLAGHQAGSLGMGIRLPLSPLTGDGERPAVSSSLVQMGR